MKKYLFIMIFMFLFSIVSFAQSVLSGKNFILLENNKPTEISISFKGNGVNGNSGLNSFFGEYSVKGDKITWVRMGTTLLAGPPELMDKESNFMGKLGMVDTFSLKKDILTFKLKNGETMVFKEMKGKNNGTK